MADEVFRFRPVPLKQRCDRCRAAATVLFDKLILCGECFLEESKRRFGIVSGNQTVDQISTQTDSRRTA
jgi:hypothetical protein